MIKIFETLEKYNAYTNNGQNLESGNLYFVKEDNSTHYFTNNIDGVSTIYDTVETPSGNIEITANSESLDIAEYATASVNVPIPEGYIIPSGNKEITANGENIDVNDYATATVNVPIPQGYIIPTGNKSITENGENIDVSQYATATVNVPSLDPSDMINLIERDITSINIPSGTTTIGQYAFNSCSALTSVTIPNSVTFIGTSAFQGCTGLTSINIPSGVTSIGQSAFNSCRGLTNVTIPNSVTSIGTAAFRDCTSLTSVTVECPNFVGQEFTHSAANASLNISSNVSTITVYNAYSSLSHNFTTVNIDSNNQNYSDKGYNYIYENATNTLLFGNDLGHIPSETVVIDSYAFKDSTDTSGIINIPNNVTTINSNAFKCKMQTVTIGSGVTSIGRNAFSPTPYNILSSVTVLATTPPTLGLSNFSNAASNFTIYVPAESVDAYKAATNWSSFASKIQAIPTT